MPVDYPNQKLLHEDNLEDFGNWHHEGIGEIKPAPDGGMRLHCFGSKQGGQGCMAFFRPNLPDHVAFEYDVAVRSHGGLLINYLAIRGQNGEDMIEDAGKLPERTGVMKDYWGHEQGLQSYHVSISRFNDKGEHTETSNWRRNPGCRLVGHGIDPCQEINREYHIRVVKDWGHCQLFADGRFAHAFMDYDQSFPIPDTGKFGFRTIGSDVMVDIRNFRIFSIEHNEGLFLTR
jgi:hypothetical protein